VAIDPDTIGKLDFPRLDDLVDQARLGERRHSPMGRPSRGDWLLFGGVAAAIVAVIAWLAAG
jgi:hypothetical protein